MTLDGGQVVIIAGIIGTAFANWCALRSKAIELQTKIRSNAMELQAKMQQLHDCLHEGIAAQAVMHVQNESVQQATLVKVEEIADKISDGKRD